ncbi:MULTISPECIES: hypothetical protein [unclassified Streptomyces]|uniref:hypothetical protein n=1 Tax=unclassified Streptomyces TaxID=2593676 RepID=UPI0035E316BA
MPDHTAACSAANTDATGNVLGLADSSGKRTHTYGPTGLPRTTPTESVPQPYRYAGAYADQTCLRLALRWRASR